MIRGPAHWYNGHRGVADEKPKVRQWGKIAPHVRDIIRQNPDLTMAQVAERAETTISYVCEIAKKSGLRPRRIYKPGYRDTMLKHVDPA